MTTTLLRVKVTQDHIERGEREDCFACPIALALKQAGHPGDVYATEVWFDHCDPILSGINISNLPEEAAAFVEAFDNYKEVQPFEFDLEVSTRE